MEENKLLIQALRNSLIQLKIYEMQVSGFTDEEIQEFSDNNVISMRDVKGKGEFFGIMDILEKVGLDVCQRFDIDDISLFFGVTSDSLNKEMSKVSEESDFVDMSNDDDCFLNNLMFHTIHEMIVDGDYPDRMPEELINKSLEFFSKEEDFIVCKDIKDFIDSNKRIIVSDMSSQEFELWQQKNIWKLHV